MKHLFALLALLLVAAPAGAQEWPQRPVRVIVAYPAGGVLDVITRAVMEPLREKLGQPVVVENRSGGNGYIGLEACAREQDQHTFCAVTIEVMVFHPFVERENFPRIASLQPVTQFTRGGGVIFANNDVPVRDLREFVGWARQRPGQLNYSSFGMGSTPHIVMEWLKATERLDMTHVPYRGSPEAMNEVIGGRIQLSYTGMGFALPQIRAGRVKALAVAGDRRWPQLPDVPSLRELGFDYPYAGGWFGLVAPEASAPATRRRMAAAIGEVVRDPAFRTRVLEPQAYEAIGNTPDEFAGVLAAERERGAALARLAGF